MSNKSKGPGGGKGGRGSAGDYAVGYGRPPKHGQFKPGNHFGKTSGRKKGKRNEATELRELLETKMEAPGLDGKRKKRTLLTIANTQVVAKAMKGDVKAWQALHDLRDRLGLTEALELAGGRELSAEEEGILEDELQVIFAAMGIDAADFAAFMAAKNATQEPQPQLLTPSSSIAPESACIFISKTVRRVNFSLAVTAGEGA